MSRWKPSWANYKTYRANTSRIVSTAMYSTNCMMITLSIHSYIAFLSLFVWLPRLSKNHESLVIITIFVFFSYQYNIKETFISFACCRKIDFSSLNVQPYTLSHFMILPHIIYIIQHSCFTPFKQSIQLYNNSSNSFCILHRQQSITGIWTECLSIYIFICLFCCQYGCLGIICYWYKLYLSGLYLINLYIKKC